MKSEPWCPVAFTARTVAGKWKPTILLCLKDRPSRFGELRRMIPGVTARALTLQLRALEEDGLVERDDRSEPSILHVEYRLTAKAHSLGAILDAMYEWGESNRPAAAAKA